MCSYGCVCVCFFFFKQKTAYEMLRSLVGSEMCIRDRVHSYHIHRPPSTHTGEECRYVLPRRLYWSDKGGSEPGDGSCGGWLSDRMYWSHRARSQPSFTDYRSYKELPLWMLWAL
eukprot:TRINITY_DN24866_c0_g3_i2.p2 TRINITY_DN24866_c0_g3~~TRINITY_DN24866_c0_g3_i2.p2  ORF type:complete len:115 (+),score=16.33 TRINITY_DN24866_c0_g3_i2:36-380(+)